MAGVLDEDLADIHRVQVDARTNGATIRPRGPMIVLRSPKGWTGPKVVDRIQIEGTFRSHRVPLLVDSAHPEHVALLENWMKSYRPEELFDDEGRFLPELAELAPKGDRRMGANPHTNGGTLLRDLRMPDFCAHAIEVPSPGAVDAKDTLVLGAFLRDVVSVNEDRRLSGSSGPTRRSRTFSPPSSRPRTASGMLARSRTTNSSGPRARARIDVERAPVRGMAGGLSAHRGTRHLQLLRGVHPHRTHALRRHAWPGYARDPGVEVGNGATTARTGTAGIAPNVVVTAQRLVDDDRGLPARVRQRRLAAHTCA